MSTTSIHDYSHTFAFERSNKVTPQGLADA